MASNSDRYHTWMRSVPAHVRAGYEAAKSEAERLYWEDLYAMPLSELKKLANAEAGRSLEAITTARLTREIEEETLNGLLEERE